jgi:hypothetical protein
VLIFDCALIAHSLQKAIDKRCWGSSDAQKANAPNTVGLLRSRH